MSNTFNQYEWNVQKFGRKWADRVACDKPLPELTQERGCNNCAGYGHPGWQVQNNNWVKCECNNASILPLQ